MAEYSQKQDTIEETSTKCLQPPEAQLPESRREAAHDSPYGLLHP